MSGQHESRRLRARSQALFEALDEGVVFHDHENRVILANAAAARILRVAPDDLLNATPFDQQWCGTREDGSPMPGEEHPAVVALRTGATVANVVMQISCGDGSRAWLSVNASPLFEGGTTTPTGVVASFRDVTAERNTEAALRASDARFRLLFDSTVDSVFFFDPDTLQVLDVNQAAERTYGYTRAELLEMSIPDISAEPEVTRAYLARTMPGAAFVIPQRRHRRRDGSEFPVAISGGTIEHDGRSIGYGIARDESDRLAAEATLREAELDRHRRNAEVERHQLEAELIHTRRLESLGRLAGGIAHDFNNLLGVISNYATFIARRLDTDSEVVDDVAAIRRAARQAAELTRELLLFSRREVGRAEAFDLTILVNEVVAMLQRPFGDCITISSPAPGVPVRVVADRAQIEQLLMNLLLNARDAIVGHGRISVAAVSVSIGSDDPSTDRAAGLGPGTYALLTVVDDGMGMAPEVVDRAFEPYFTTKGRDHGTGLGLATVHGIATRAGGCVTLSSRPGSGTTARVYLPAEPVDAPARADGSETILLVDDQSSVRTMTGRILRDGGYEVVEAAEPEHAIRLASEIAPALLLTDLVMPGMTGTELATRLCTDHPALKVAYISAHAAEVLSDGSSVALVQKPFEPDELLHRVRQVLDAPAPSRV